MKMFQRLQTTENFIIPSSAEKFDCGAATLQISLTLQQIVVQMIYLSKGKLNLFKNVAFQRSKNSCVYMNTFFVLVLTMFYIYV